MILDYTIKVSFSHFMKLVLSIFGLKNLRLLKISFSQFYFPSLDSKLLRHLKFRVWSYN